MAAAWVLASACLVHHLGHFLGAGAPKWVHLLGSHPVTAALSALALLGPGRQIVGEGFAALARGAPDMNSLVGLGAGAAFSISAVAAALPALGWRTFFEEPAMLLGVVLVGRALEERAKLRASADMAALQVSICTGRWCWCWHGGTPYLCGKSSLEHPPPSCSPFLLAHPFFLRRRACSRRAPGCSSQTAPPGGRSPPRLWRLGTSWRCCRATGCR